MEFVGKSVKNKKLPRNGSVFAGREGAIRVNTDQHSLLGEVTPTKLELLYIEVPIIEIATDFTRLFLLCYNSDSRTVFTHTFLGSSSIRNTKSEPEISTGFKGNYEKFNFLTNKI